MKTAPLSCFKCFTYASRCKQVWSPVQQKLWQTKGKWARTYTQAQITPSKQVKHDHNTLIKYLRAFCARQNKNFTIKSQTETVKSQLNWSDACLHAKTSFLLHIMYLKMDTVEFFGLGCCDKLGNG